MVSAAVCAPNGRTHFPSSRAAPAFSLATSLLLCRARKASSAALDEGRVSHTCVARSYSIASIVTGVPFRKWTGGLDHRAHLKTMPLPPCKYCSLTIAATASMSLTVAVARGTNGPWARV